MWYFNLLTPCINALSEKRRSLLALRHQWVSRTCGLVAESLVAEEDLFTVQQWGVALNEPTPSLSGGEWCFIHFEL